jgi:hypothetical protein
LLRQKNIHENDRPMLYRSDWELKLPFKRAWIQIIELFYSNFKKLQKGVQRIDTNKFNFTVLI